MELDELIHQLETLWPHRFSRGLITHIHANDLTCADGSKVHLRVLIQDRPHTAQAVPVLSELTQPAPTVPVLSGSTDTPGGVPTAYIDSKIPNDDKTGKVGIGASNDMPALLALTTPDNADSIGLHDDEVLL